jgi:hypothetical protein
LPAELRNQIYGYVLSGKSISIDTTLVTKFPLAKETDDADEPGVFNDVDGLLSYKRSHSRVDPVIESEMRPKYGAYIAPYSDLHPELFLRWENSTWHNNGPSHTFALLNVSRQLYTETKSLPFELNAIRFLNSG